jgi:site-specific DNA-cytosine methylase
VTAKWSKGGGPAGDEAYNLTVGPAAESAHAFDARQSSVVQYEDKSGPLDTDGHTVGVLAPQAQAFSEDGRGEVRLVDGDGQRAGTLTAGGGKPGQGFAAVMVPQPYTLEIRGRDGERVLEYRQDGLANCLRTSNGGRDGLGIGGVAEPPQAQAFAQDQHGEVRLQGGDGQLAGALTAGGGSPGSGFAAVMVPRSGVRRLTPTECERLQGFPDGWTAIPYRGKPAEQCPDGPRYKALGNSMAVPVVRWIGQNLQRVAKDSSGQ